MAKRALRSPRPTSPKRSSARSETSAGTVDSTNPRGAAPTAPGMSPHRVMTLPGFMAERAVGAGGSYWGALSLAGGLVSGMSPQQKFLQRQLSFAAVRSLRHLHQWEATSRSHVGLR